MWAGLTQILEKRIDEQFKKNYRRVMVLNVRRTADESTKINWLF